MTVKRRLFISNILMIVIPVLLSIVVGAVVLGAIVGIFDLHQDRNFNNSNEYTKAVSLFKHLSNQWSSSSPEKITEDVAAFGRQFSQQRIALAVYQNDVLLCASGVLADEVTVQTVLERAGNYTLIMDETIIIKKDTDAYTALLFGADYNTPYSNLTDELSPQPAIYYGIIAFSVVIAVILITNQMLTRVIYNSIAVPLDALEYGVHQLRDGNLEYRIEYAGKDEFAGVCADFNEMAGRLLDMVNARQKDDENRRELIAGISHDLRTPLTSIISYVEGLEKGIATTPAAQKKYFYTIKNKAMDLEHIVSQLFLFSKLDVGEFPFKMERLDIGNEVHKFVASISEEYERKGLRVVLDTVLQGCVVSVDAVQLRNVLTNILDNSLKYGRTENSIIRIACNADEQNAIITLTDNGLGVAEEALENLFTAFYRGDRARNNPGQGSGLGLAITAKILERLGGNIHAENAPDGGLRVIIKLPVITGGLGNEKNINS